MKKFWKSVNFWGRSMLLKRNSCSCTKFQLNIFIFEQAYKLYFCIKAKCPRFGPGREFLWLFFELFALTKYAKIALKLFASMPKRSLPARLQLNIFIFEATACLQTLLQSLKQNSDKSARLGTFCGKFSNFFVWRNMKKHQ